MMALMEGSHSTRTPGLVVGYHRGKKLGGEGVKQRIFSCEGNWKRGKGGNEMYNVHVCYASGI